MNTIPHQHLDLATPEPYPGSSAVAVTHAQPAPIMAGISGTPAAQPQLHFRFDGGAASWFGVQLLGALVTMFTLGICLPWAIVMTHRWQAKHTYVNGYRLRFTGDAWSLFGQWIKWLGLIVVTVGIYSFWVYPRMMKWIVEHQEIDPATLPR